MPGVDHVWHFAANADIPLGASDTAVDLRTSVQLTRLVLESMREHGADKMLFPSTSGVYGRLGGRALREDDGPLLPQSMYAAGKLGCEGLISAYSYTFGLHATVFRLGNVVGGQMGRGIVRDFVDRLRRDPETLPVLGNGRQRKSYVLVDDVIEGMQHIGSAEPVDDDEPCDVYNLAAGGSVDVAGVAREVARALELPAPRLVPSGDVLSWPGDQPIVELSIEKALRTGWRPQRTAPEAIAESARRIATKCGVQPGAGQ
jgi:UDP-glucose 4-epimerase